MACPLSTLRSNIDGSARSTFRCKAISRWTLPLLSQKAQKHGTRPACAALFRASRSAVTTKGSHRLEFDLCWWHEAESSAVGRLCRSGGREGSPSARPSRNRVLCRPIRNRFRLPLRRELAVHSSPELLPSL